MTRSPATAAHLARSRRKWAAAYALVWLEDHGARVELAPDRGILRGPYKQCAAHDCPDPTLHLNGRYCGPHTFTRLPPIHVDPRRTPA